MRHLVESLVLLAVAVTLFRGFAAEGYMISTGSMAPGLLGYHRRIVCPDCHSLFARGAAFDPDDGSLAETALADFDETSQGFPQTCCPNCGRLDIAAWQIPRNEGDQLLVHKFAYEIRDPRRWEVIVFRNPADPRQAYVKRVAGLPNETISIRHGDVYADGALCRKPLSAQRGTRILVADFSHRPSQGDPDGGSRWVQTPDVGWSLSPDGCEFRGPEAGTVGRIEYRHWIRHGGRHTTSVPLSQWPAGVDPPNPNLENFEYLAGRLVCVGTFADLDWNRWKTRSDEPEYQRALRDLFEQSHLAPVTDEYGYNAPESSGAALVNDFMVTFELTHHLGEGYLDIELEAGGQRVLTRFDFGQGLVQLGQPDQGQWDRTAQLPESIESRASLVEFSCFDCQALLAIDGVEVFEPWLFEPTVPPVPTRHPLRLNASGIECSLRQLRLYRDVYYTDKSDSPAADCRLGPESFFVLGDNSPVSVDSRIWEDPRVPRSALIGKPLVVHLPSRQALWNWDGSPRYVRVPDFSRVRLVH